MSTQNDKFSITTLLPDLYGGTFEAQVTNALRESALAVASHENSKVHGKVTVELSLKRLADSRQIVIDHKLKYDYPTTKGKRTEELTTSTPVYCSARGALSLAPKSQLPLFGKEEA